MSSDSHGPDAKQNQDVIDLCSYAAGRFDVVCWESVQQALSVGRPLVRRMVETLFAPRGYRVAHVKLNAATFGNAQQRKRYFFVAYRREKNFNVTVPAVNRWLGTVYDAVWRLRDRLTRRGKNSDYDRDTWLAASSFEEEIIKDVPNGYGVKDMVRYAPQMIPERYHRRFGEFSPYRLNWLRPSPTLHTGSSKLVHPDWHRFLTVGELAAIMGWPDDACPIGKNPVQQLAKGIVPAVGTWLAEQVKLYAEDAWREEDWESSYDPVAGQWVGRDVNGALEKTFDLTKYVNLSFDIDRYPAQVHRQSHPYDWERYGNADHKDADGARGLRGDAPQRA